MRALHAAAVARMKAVYAADRVHESNEVPAKPALPYSVVTVDTGLPRNLNLAGQHGTRLVTVAVQCIGSTVNECLFVAEKADDAFLEHALAAEGWDCTTATGSASRPRRDPDGGGVVYALAVYEFEASSDDESDVPTYVRVRDNSTGHLLSIVTSKYDPALFTLIPAKRSDWQPPKHRQSISKNVKAAKKAAHQSPSTVSPTRPYPAMPEEE